MPIFQVDNNQLKSQQVQQKSAVTRYAPHFKGEQDSFERSDDSSSSNKTLFAIGGLAVLAGLAFVFRKHLSELFSKSKTIIDDTASGPKHTPTSDQPPIDTSSSSKPTGGDQVDSSIKPKEPEPPEASPKAEPQKSPEQIIQETIERNNPKTPKIDTGAPVKDFPNAKLTREYHDKKGRLIRIWEGTVHDGRKYIIEDKYDSNGLMIARTYKTESGQIINKFNYKYYRSGNPKIIKQSKLINGRMQKIGTTRYYYDKEQRLTREYIRWSHSSYFDVRMNSDIVDNAEHLNGSYFDARMTYDDKGRLRQRIEHGETIKAFTSIDATTGGPLGTRAACRRSHTTIHEYDDKTNMEIKITDHNFLNSPGRGVRITNEEVYYDFLTGEPTKKIITSRKAGRDDTFTFTYNPTSKQWEEVK